MAPNSQSPAFDLGRVGRNRVLHIHTRQGEDAAVSVAQAVRAYQPAAVVAVGICWGAWGPDSGEPSDKQQLIGDVLIADKLKSTGAKRLKDGATDYPDDQVKTTRRLADSLMLVLPFWSQQPGHRHDMGLMLSEPTLYNDAQARDAVLKAFPKAMGGEMEAQGLARWAAELKTDWIMFKGICDWGANKDNPNKEADQKLAAQRAASLLAMWLQNAHLGLSSPSAASPPEATAPAGTPSGGGNQIIQGNVQNAINAPGSTFHLGGH
ncbi:MAG: hypothetical protein U5L74_07285 [Ideonella sp.]|nr:hypothetical protein [Ideonella sp.]